MDPKWTNVTELKVAGIEIRTTNQAEMNPSTAKIPSLWGHFYKIQGDMPRKSMDARTLGVYSKYESDHAGPYSLLAGVEVSRLDDLLDGITGATIPAGNYLVFTAQGSMPQALIKTWGAIWAYFSGDPKYQRAYTFDFELYQAPDRVDIHIAVK